MKDSSFLNMIWKWRSPMTKLRPNQFTLSSGAIITEIPLLFSTPMIQANLEGRKSQTRRTRGLETINENPDLWTREDAKTTLLYQSFKDFDDKVNWAPLFEFIKTTGQEEDKTYFIRPRQKPGDLLWFRETCANLNGDFPGHAPYNVFKADIQIENQHGPVTWKPSIHMPKAASRIWAMVKDIRVERVQDISEDDAIAEGIEPTFNSPIIKYRRYKDYGDETSVSVLPKTSFQSLWISINGIESWKSNPWVWVIQYRILSKTGRPSLDTIAEAYDEVVNQKSKIVNQDD